MSRLIWVKPHFRNDNGNLTFVHGYYRTIDGKDQPNFIVYKDAIGEYIFDTKFSDKKMLFSDFSGVNLKNVSFINVDLQGSYWGGLNPTCEYDTVLFSGTGLRDNTFDFVNIKQGMFTENNLDFTRMRFAETGNLSFVRNNGHRGFTFNIGYKGTEQGSSIEFEDNDFSLSDGYNIGNYISLGGEKIGVNTVKFSRNNFDVTNLEENSSELSIYADDVDFRFNNLRGNVVKLHGVKEFWFDSNKMDGAYIEIDGGTISGPKIFTNNTAIGAGIIGDFRNTDFSNSILRKATLDGDFRGASFKFVDLRGADLRNAKLDKDALINATIDKNTKLPWGLEKSYKERNKLWEPDQNWAKKNYPVIDDPIFEIGAKNYNIQIRERMMGGSSPVIRVKIKGDGTGVEKLVNVTEKDISKRAGETIDIYKLRQAVIKNHNGVNEVIGYRLSKLLGLDIVPDTIFTHRSDGRPVTIQKFIQSASTMEDIPEPTGDSADDFNDRKQKMYLIDALMGNGDRHEGNMMLQITNTDIKLWAIDFGHSAPDKKTIDIGYSDRAYHVDRLYTKFDRVPKSVWEKINTISQKDFFKAFDDLLTDEDFINYGGRLALDAVWDKIEMIQKTNDRLYGMSEKVS